MTRKIDGPLVLGSRLGLRPSEAAAALGISERSLRKILPELPYTRLGTSIVIPVDALQHWLAERVSSRDQQAERTAQEILEAIERASNE